MRIPVCYFSQSWYDETPLSFLRSDVDDFLSGPFHHSVWTSGLSHIVFLSMFAVMLSVVASQAAQTNVRYHRLPFWKTELNRLCDLFGLSVCLLAGLLKSYWPICIKILSQMGDSILGGIWIQGCFLKGETAYRSALCWVFSLLQQNKFHICIASDSWFI